MHLGRRALAALAIATASCSGAGHVVVTSQAVPPSTGAQPAAASAAPPFVPPRFPSDWPYPQGGPAPRSASGMVASDAALATKVGVDVLKAGGNAADAAIATAFALAVVFPTAGNLGGGGFLVGRVRGESRALDFRETAPAAATRDMYLGADGKPTRDSRDGWRSSGVPGSVAGLYEAWHGLGSRSKTMSWPNLLAPAIALAEGGFVVDEAFFKSINLVKARLARYPASAALFLPGGEAPAIGTTWRNPELGAALRRVAELGPAGFYEGPVAEAIARAMRESGGLITERDLAQYHAKWREPVEFTYRGRTVIGMPPPSSGGVTTAMIAHLAAGWDLRSLGWHSATEVHLLAESMRRAFAARNAALGDPDFVKNPVAELLSDAWAIAQAKTILPDRATPTRDLFPAAQPRAEGPHTTHLSVVDVSGNAVALTTTINAWFGSGATVPGMGFVMNDEMDDFATVPGAPNMFGLVQSEPNAVAPGKRMLSSMSPTIVLGERGDVDLVLGAAGGSRIITTVFEELSNAVDFGMDPADAVRAPRFHQQDAPDVLFLEPRALGADVRGALTAMGHATEEVEHIADAPGLGRAPGVFPSVWQGAPEPRRPGSLALGL